jgi:anti-sigma factor RsiW
MSYSCAEWRGDIGAYIVGALDARARTQVRRHLAACAGCRAEYDDLVPVRAWLGRLALDGGRPDTGRAEQPGNPPHASFPSRSRPAVLLVVHDRASAWHCRRGRRLLPSRSGRRHLELNPSPAISWRR